MLQEGLEGDYLLQFAFINYVSPDTFSPKLQAKDKNAKKKNFNPLKYCRTS